jgi:hypothetical protein
VSPGVLSCSSRIDPLGEQALLDAGAHVEYLHQLGQLAIANLDEVARARDPVIEYVARS